jgi:hypothetical protein
MSPIRSVQLCRRYFGKDFSDFRGKREERNHLLAVAPPALRSRSTTLSAISSSLFAAILPSSLPYRASLHGSSTKFPTPPEAYATRHPKRAPGQALANRPDEPKVDGGWCTEHHFRKVASYRAIPKLVAALHAHDETLGRQRGVYNPKQAA